MKHIAILIRNPERAEGLRMAMGFAGPNRVVDVFFLEHDLARASNFIQGTDPLPAENIGFYSDDPVNVQRYGFQYATRDEIAERVKQAELVIPY